MTSSAGPAAQSLARRGPGRLVYLYALGMALALPCFVLLATERYTLLARLLAWLGFGVSLLPALVMLARPGSRMNGVAATGLVVAVFYHTGVFHERRLMLRWGAARISDSSVEVALLLAALAVPALWLGWYLAGVLRLGRAVPHLRLEVPPRRLHRAGVLLVLWSLTVHVLWLRGMLLESQPVVGLLSATAPTELGFAMMVVHRLRGHATARDRIVFWALIAAFGVLSLALGMILIIIRPFLVYLLGWLYLGRRVRIGPIAAVLGVVLLMQPVKGEFRQRVWDRSVELGIADRALLYVQLLGRHWLAGELDPTVDPSQSVEAAAARTGGSLALANVIELSPGSVPRQYGATYRYLLYTFIPRAFYPEKPIAQYADVWAAVMFGYTTERGTAHVMIGLSQIAEAYINFGLAGGLLTLLLIGAVYRICDEILGHPQAGTGALAIYLYQVLNAMVGLEGSFAQFWGGVPQTFLLYGVALAPLAARRLGAPRPGAA